jgi:hypothetical protein
LTPLGVRLSSTRLHAGALWQTISEAKQQRKPVLA